MKNQIFLVFDSLRYDIFLEASTPFLDSLGKWARAYSPGNYTFPAHFSFFVGKLPQSYDNIDFYDAAASRINSDDKLYRNSQLWRLGNPEAPRTAKYHLEGKNIIEGFKKKGFTTIGTGAMNWFNPKLPAGKYLTEPFDHFAFFDGPNNKSHESAEEQIEWSLDKIASINQPFFLFINFGETHHRFVYKNCTWHDDPNPYGNAEECKKKQKLCLEYLDNQTNLLLSRLSNYDLVICSDHGEAMGEDGLWGHSFHHEKVIEVPLLINATPITNFDKSRTNFSKAFQRIKDIL
jgi:hypothetical protein